MLQVISIITACVILECEVDAGYISNSTDFGVVKALNKYFFDNTWFIRDFINNENRDRPVKMIMAPARSGKTTVLDMVKRFIKARVDENGDPLYTKDCDDYRLFCAKPLNICCKNNTEFVKRNFGKYPVMHIDYRPLRQTRSVEHFLQLLHGVIRKTFSEHSYMTNNSLLFLEKQSRDQFTRYYDPPGVTNLTRTDICVAFKWLTELMFLHFNNKVIVLLDEYDGFYYSKLYYRFGDEWDVYNNFSLEYLHDIHDALFTRNVYMGKALLTGSKLLSDLEHLPEVRNNLEMMDDHKLLIDVWMTNIAGTLVEDVSY